jgi:hypothetical protein
MAAAVAGVDAAKKIAAAAAAIFLHKKHTNYIGFI